MPAMMTKRAWWESMKYRRQEIIPPPSCWLSLPCSKQDESISYHFDPCWVPICIKCFPVQLNVSIDYCPVVKAMSVQQWNSRIFHTYLPPPIKHFDSWKYFLVTSSHHTITRHLSHSMAWQVKWNLSIAFCYIYQWAYPTRIECP